jgi:hypothetical protein
MYCPEERLQQFGRFRWPNFGGRIFLLCSNLYFNILHQRPISALYDERDWSHASRGDQRCISPVRESKTSRVVVQVLVVFLDDWRRSSRSPLLLLLLLLILVALLLAVEGCLLVRYLDAHNCP